jgi:hypothetical protein
MKGLIAVLCFAILVAVFLIGTKVGAVQQAERGYSVYRVIHEYRAKCINVAPKARKAGHL